MKPVEEINILISKLDGIEDSLLIGMLNLKLEGYRNEYLEKHLFTNEQFRDAASGARTHLANFIGEYPYYDRQCKNRTLIEEVVNDNPDIIKCKAMINKLIPMLQSVKYRKHYKFYK